MLDELLGDMDTGCLPSPYLYQYYKNLNNNCVVINDSITENIIEQACLPLMEMDKNENVKHIDIILCTRGGSLYYGFALCDIIDKLKTPTTITILGMAASMGCCIAMAGYNNPCVTTQAYVSSVGLLHSGSEFLEGSSHAVRDTFKFTERYEEYVKNYILTHSDIDSDFYDSIDRKEYWMTAQDMLKHKIIDKII